MLKKSSNFLSLLWRWFEDNNSKLIVLAGLHFLLLYVLSLPYFNLIKIVFSFFVYLIDWLLILILFRPQKEKILKLAFYLFAVGFIFGILNIGLILELIGMAAYLFLATYFVLLLFQKREGKKN